MAPDKRGIHINILFHKNICYEYSLEAALQVCQFDRNFSDQNFMTFNVLIMCKSSINIYTVSTGLIYQYIHKQLEFVVPEIVYNLKLCQ